MYYSPAYDRDEPCYACGSVIAECECTLEIEEALSDYALSEYKLTQGDYTSLSLRQRVDQLRYWHAMSAYNGRSEE